MRLMRMSNHLKNVTIKALLLEAQHSDPKELFTTFINLLHHDCDSQSESV